MTAISDKYAQLGGATGWLGAALTGEVPAANGGLKQEFRAGTIYWRSATGAFEVHGQIRQQWLALGGEGSAFGYPTSDETPTADGVGRYNDFEHASVYWHPSTGAFEVHGAIKQRWVALGGTSSKLGYPTSNESTTLDGAGRYNHFEHGSVFWSSATGAHEIDGPIRARWAELRWERGLLGYPVATPYTLKRSRDTFQVVEFQGGKVELNLSTQRVLVHKLSTVGSPNYSIPVVAYRVSDDDGSRACAITTDGVQQWIEEANRIFAAAGIQFVYDGVLRDLADTQVNNVTGEDYPYWASVKAKLNQLAANHGSIVLAHRAAIGGGFSSSDYDFVAMSYFDSVHPNALTLLAHELGHFLGLQHTFGKQCKTVREAEDFVLSGGHIADLDADSPNVTDTPPDLDIEELREQVSIDAVTLAGQPVALQRKNIMSYWDHGGKGELSHGQIDRVRRLVQERGARYLNVSEIAPANCTALLEQLTATQQRLIELIEERDAETDPKRRARYRPLITKVKAEIRRLENEGHASGCL